MDIAVNQAAEEALQLIMSDVVASALFETKEGQRSPAVPGKRNGR